MEETFSKVMHFFSDPFGSEAKPVRAANAPFDQPELDPKRWFLTDKEITTARGGHHRPNLATYTTGNHVTMYAAGAPYFAAACDAIQSTRNHDRVYLTGWSVDNVPFKPDDPNTSFQDLIEGAVNRGADVRMLVWANVTEKEQNHKMRDFVNALPAPTFAGPARFVYDDRLPYATSSHHQKSLIVRRGNQLYAFVGGVDLTNERWDTVAHDQAELRVSAGIKTSYNGWLDSHCRIEGPAAKDVAWNFLQRWNAEPKPTQDLLDDVMDFENPEFGRLPAVDAPYPGEQPTHLDIPTDGTHAVQILRTFSPECEAYKDFAPVGEQGIFHARIKAIRNAKNYIFIQDQYFILVPELLDELTKILPSIERLIVVVQRTVEAGYTGYAKYLYDMVAPLQEKFPDKFKLYTTKESRELYIHSKIVIIDDVYVSHGSANWNRRSMTSDSEIGCNIVDTELITNADNITVNKLAHSFRLQKFAEATKLPYKQLEQMTFIEACDALEAAAHDDGSSLIEPYGVKDSVAFNFVPDFVRDAVDPDPAPDTAANI